MRVPMSSATGNSVRRFSPGSTGSPGEGRSNRAASLKKFSASAPASSSASILARNSGSPAQASSRKARRDAARGRFRAASNNVSSFGFTWSREDPALQTAPSRLRPDALEKPGFRISPMTLDRAFRHSQILRDFLVRQSAEEFHHDDPGLFGVFRPQAFQGFIDEQNFFVGRGRRQVQIVNVHLDLPAAALQSGFAPGVFDQYPPHRLG